MAGWREVSKTLNEDFLYFIPREGGCDLALCLFSLPKQKGIWSGVSMLGDTFWRIWCLGTFFEDLLSARSCSKHFTCINSFNPHSSSQVRCFSIPIFNFQMRLSNFKIKELRLRPHD